MAEKSLREIDFRSLTNRSFFPSPEHWEDQVIYFLMVDRFSDGKENGFRDNQGNLVTTGTTPLFAPADNGNAVGSDQEAQAWREAGTSFVGGKLAGVESKLGYLQRLGITAVWLSPVFKQVNVDTTYHGYGIQHFLDVDPNFGTRDDLRRLVQTAHSLGIRVIMDIILNHTGRVFEYQAADTPWTGHEYDVKGFRDSVGQPTVPFAPVDPTAHPEAFPDTAVWPLEFQSANRFTRQGYIRHWDDHPEYADGDFDTLRDLHHGERDMVNDVDQIDNYAVSDTLRYLGEVYKFWIAFADIDGFRLDTVKHIDPGAARYFASVVHEFAEAIGKDNFYIIGEITGGRGFAVDRLEATGLDAALGIADERITMNGLVRGDNNPEKYFDLFRDSLQVGKDSHVWFRDKVVTSVDDHDHVDQGDQKHRFSAGGFEKLALAAMALNAMTLGIPCIYYGTEQFFDGEGGSDRYIREAMFGGAFGAFRSRGRHFFNEAHATYVELTKIHKLRSSHLTLRRGRQYLRPISGDGVIFGFPQRMNGRMLSLVAWSRIFNGNEVLCALNTDPDNRRTAFVTVDNELHQAGDKLTCLYSPNAGEIGQTVGVEARNGKAVSLAVPAAGFVVYG